jgi:hypothetical protein
VLPVFETAQFSRKKRQCLPWAGNHTKERHSPKAMPLFVKKLILICCRTGALFFQGRPWGLSEVVIGLIRVCPSGWRRISPQAYCRRIAQKVCSRQQRTTARGVISPARA